MTTTLEETTSAWELDHDASRTTRTVGDIWRVTQRRPHTPEQAHLALLMANDAPPKIAAMLKRGIARRMNLCACDWCLTTGHLVSDADPTPTTCPACEGRGYTL